MAKMFYTLDETKAALGKNEEEIKQFSREGRLREFRDGPRLMFKADQVEQLRNELAGGEGISLAPVEEVPLGLADESAAPVKGDTHLDVGGSAAGKSVPPGSGLVNIGSGVGSGAGSGGGSGGTRAGGITIFDVDDSQKADPSAQTAINASIQDQISLESVGSGSGLLDLTRESDDTSLGAVFDELRPPGPAKVPSAVGLEETQAGDTVPAPEPAATLPVSAPIYVEQPDAMGSGIGAAALAGAIVVIILGFLLWGVVMGYRPPILENLTWEKDLKMYLVGALGVALVFWGIGYAVARMTNK